MAIVSTAAYFREAHLKSVADYEKEQARQAEVHAEQQKMQAEDSAGQADVPKAKPRTKPLGQRRPSTTPPSPNTRPNSRSTTVTSLWPTAISRRATWNRPARSSIAARYNIANGNGGSSETLTERGRRTILPDVPARRLAFSPDGRQIAIGTETGELILWDDKAQRVLFRSRVHEKNITGVVFSPDGKKLATASEDGSTKLFTAPGCKPIFGLRGHTVPVRYGGLAFSHDGTLLADARADGTIHIWDTTSGKPSRDLSCKKELLILRGAPDNRSLFSLAQGTVVRWSTLDGQHSNLLNAE